MMFHRLIILVAWLVYTINMYSNMKYFENVQMQILYSLRNAKCRQHEDHIYTTHNAYIVVDSNDTCLNQ